MIFGRKFWWLITTITRAIRLIQREVHLSCNSENKLWFRSRGMMRSGEWQVFSPTIRVWYYIGILLKALDAIGAEGQGRRFVTGGRGVGPRCRQIRHPAVVMRVLLRSGSVAQLDSQHDHEDHQEQPRCGSHNGAQQWTRQR